MKGIIFTTKAHCRPEGRHDDDRQKGQLPDSQIHLMIANPVPQEPKRSTVGRDRPKPVPKDELQIKLKRMDQERDRIEIKEWTLGTPGDENGGRNGKKIQQAECVAQETETR